MNVYKVTYKTRWSGDVEEECQVTTSAKDADTAIEKAKKYTGKESYKEDDGTIHKRVMFKLEGVEKVLSLDI